MTLRKIYIMELIFTLQQLPDAARDFIKAMGDNRLFAFNGDMGAGKTTFITGGMPSAWGCRRLRKPYLQHCE